MSDRIENLENTFRWVEQGRESVAQKQAELDDAYRDHFGHYFAEREELFAELADEDRVKDGDIVDYAEASMRLDGVSASDASERAGQLVEIFAPSPGAPALPVYFRNGNRSVGDQGIFAVRPASASEDSLWFRLARDKSNSEVHDLTVRAEGTPNVFREGYLSLSSGGGDTVGWTYGRDGVAKVSLRDLQVTDDPERAAQITRNTPGILIGEAAVAAIDPHGGHNHHESVALKAIVTGQEPSFDEYGGYGSPDNRAADETKKRIKGYAARLLTDLAPTKQGELRDRVPVQFHPAILPLVLSQAEAEVALLEGVAKAGDVLSLADISLIEARVENSPRHRNTGRIVDNAIAARLERLGSIAGAVQVESGLSIELPSLMHAALQSPDLYRSLALRGNKSLSSVARQAVGAYVWGTPRFRGMHAGA